MKQTEGTGMLEKEEYRAKKCSYSESQHGAGIQKI